VKEVKQLFTAVESFFLILGLFFTALVIRSMMIDFIPGSQIGIQVKMLVLGVWAVLFLFQFKALRKKRVFIAWLIIAIIHLSIFILFFHNPHLNYLDRYEQKRNYSSFLVTPIILLLFFQGCRQFSLFFYKRELGLVSANLNTIIGEDRMANGVERICSAGMFVMPILSYYVCYYG
jgi:hypothetical protein